MFSIVVQDLDLFQDLFPLEIDSDLRLIVLNPSYADAFENLIQKNTHHLHPWISYDIPGKALIQESIKNQILGVGIRLGIFYQGILVGTLGLLNVKWKERTCELSYWLGESFQGKGLVTRCCFQLLYILFQYFHLQSIFIKVDMRNLRSQKIPVSLGFKYLKKERINNRTINVFKFTLSNLSEVLESKTFQNQKMEFPKKCSTWIRQEALGNLPEVCYVQTTDNPSGATIIGITQPFKNRILMSVSSPVENDPAQSIFNKAKMIFPCVWEKTLKDNFMISSSKQSYIYENTTGFYLRLSKQVYEKKEYADSWQKFQKKNQELLLDFITQYNKLNIEGR